MPLVDTLSSFVAHASWDRMSREAREALKIRVLDSLGCAIGALGAPPVQAVREQVHHLGGSPLCTMIGGGRTAPDRAALYNGTLVRYLDFNDSYLARGETCHPSDNLAAVLATAEDADRSGRDFLEALAVAYQVQCRLSDEAPVRAKGFDHSTQGSYAAAAGAAKALGLDEERTANAIAIAGTALNALRVTRTGALSQWKGLAYPHTGFGAVHAAYLAREGITGPREVFEGNKGFMDAISGPFEIDWGHEDLERVRRTILKKYNAEIHSQSAIEGLLELRAAHGLQTASRIEVDIFDVAWEIIGQPKEEIRTKEDADHSLPYILAVAFLDGDVGPEQYAPERIARGDVQSLLRRVMVRQDPELSERFPAEHACRIRVDGHVREKRDYEGFHTRPMSWNRVVAKFERIAGRRRAIVDAVERLEEIRVRELTALLENL